MRSFAPSGRLMKSFKLLPYDEVTQKGFPPPRFDKAGLCHQSDHGSACDIHAGVSREKAAYRGPLKTPSEITTILMNLNDRYTSMVLGNRKRCFTVLEKFRIFSAAADSKFPPSRFYQINPAQTEALYLKAMEYAGLTGSETVIDAYCGIGTIGLVAAKRGAKAVGVELNRDAVKTLENAKLNKLSNAWFCAGDAGEFMLEMSLEKSRPT